VDTFIDLAHHEIILDYVLDINKDYLDRDDEDDEESDKDARYASRNSQKKLLFASIPVMRKFVNLLVEELANHCFEIYYDYDGSKQVMENDVFLKLIDLFFKNPAIVRLPRTSLRISSREYRNGLTFRKINLLMPRLVIQKKS
jgi:hypothetical protein